MDARPGRLPVLVVEDAPDAQLVYDKMLKRHRPSSRCRYDGCAKPKMRFEKCAPGRDRPGPRAGRDEAWDFLIRLKREPRTAPGAGRRRQRRRCRRKRRSRSAPMRISSSRSSARTLIETLNGLQARMRPPIRVLVVDDDESARYLVRQLPARAGVRSDRGGRRERRRPPRGVPTQPDVILLDLVMPAMSGHELLAELRRQSAHHVTSRS